MEAIISYFEPGFINFFVGLLGKTPTEILSAQTGLPWWRVHEHIIGWLIILTILLVSALLLQRAIYCKRIKELEEVS